MIVIHNPKIDIDGDEVIISSKFILDGKNSLLWYRFPLKFKEFLVTERLDAFVVGLLFLALKTGNNIKVEGAISTRLFYTLNHYLINALCLANPKFKRIEISATKLDELDLNQANVAATGLSCGVDSFATYYDHINETGAYKIKYFTFLNAGSHGDFGGENSRKIFYKRLKKVKEFADKAEKEIIPIDSNISEILKMNFQQTHTFRNISCILNLQKLFKNYYYASGYRLDHFRLNKKDTSDADFFYLNLLSTESTNLFSSVNFITRKERTDFISNFKDTYDHLNVCTHPNFESLKSNCGACEKCLRTALTLEMNGKLPHYQEVFDLQKYFKNRNSFIGRLIVNRKLNPINAEIYQTLKQKSEIRYGHYWFALKYVINNQKKLIKQAIKKLKN